MAALFFFEEANVQEELRSHLHRLKEMAQSTAAAPMSGHRMGDIKMMNKIILSNNLYSITS